MTEELSKLQGWLPLGVAILAGVFALAGAWYGVTRGKITEHNQWRRNRKQEAYAAYLQSLSNMMSTTARVFAGLIPIETSAEKIDRANEEYTRKASYLHLVSPRVVIAASSAVKMAVDELLVTVSDHLATADEDSSKAVFDVALKKANRATTHITVLIRHDLGLLDEEKGHAKKGDEIDAELRARLSGT